ncbi:MAG TPA: SRPBCC family protein [Actinoplanes sp.]|jgi:uncharacterized protein YndB with AHSA1/START domain
MDLEDVTREDWTLIFVRELRQPPAVVWAALTSPDELDQWAPFSASRDLGAPGKAVLTLVDGPDKTDISAEVLRAQAPALLEYTWGDDRLRWELAPSGEGTRLTLRHTLAKPDTDAMVAAGWHLCLDVLRHLLDGDPIGVIRGRDALDHGWAELRDGYAAELGR